MNYAARSRPRLSVGGNGACPNALVIPAISSAYPVQLHRRAFALVAPYVKAMRRLSGEKLNAWHISKQLHQFFTDHVRFARVLKARRRDVLAD